ncbi:phospholipase A2 inhibitor and Ly6/PLAUR domain-containing protein-like [Hyla sarda]|uniref:phospholipase A2 inhibitor and Ly6/PLAUR domain-containing protein-like n=1 Tax=Hyla sarda TaxID=327740 RepID=UPI0024C39B54|nr:phospholipase A2 inhibitor and Ly6/PLAUR domain-containing protein-like [Hyla sarda]
MGPTGTDTSGLFFVAPRNLTKNGFTCPYCLESGLKGCTPTNHTQCTGLEDRCIKFSGYLGFGETPKETSYQGCATSSACPTNQKLPLNEKNGVGISCTKAPRHGSEEGDHSPGTNSTVGPTSPKSSSRGPR